MEVARDGLDGFQVIVAATAAVMAIGKNGKLPWRLPGEIANFKRVTMGGGRAACVMGRATWDSIPTKYRPLPGRVNIVVSSREAISGGFVCVNLDEALKTARAKGCEEVFVIGGARLYAAALGDRRCWRVHLTAIEDPKGELSDGCDAFFPVLRASEFGLTSRSEPVTENGVSYQFEIYDRIIEHGSVKKLADLSTMPLNHPLEILKEVLANPEEHQYLELTRRIMATGALRTDRTGIGTKSIFGASMRFSLRDGRFPLLTTKRVFWRGVAEELLWFINGGTDSTKLSSKNVKIWDGNGSREFLDLKGLNNRRVGDLGPIYGFQWRHFGAAYCDCDADYTGQGVDQLRRLISHIMSQPMSRRHILTAWNPSDIDKMALPPCHLLAQFYVADGELSCQMYQRSADMGLGVPFNIASYALLTNVLAQCCGLKPGEFVHVIGDAHVYLNHLEALTIQLKRKPRPFPKIKINSLKTDIDDFVFEDFYISEYHPHPSVKMDMAV